MQKIISPWGLWQLRKFFSKQTLEANTVFTLAQAGVV